MYVNTYTCELPYPSKRYVGMRLEPGTLHRAYVRDVSSYIHPRRMCGTWKARPNATEGALFLPPRESRVGVCTWESANAERAANFARFGIVPTKLQISFRGAEQRIGKD